MSDTGLLHQTVVAEAHDIVFGRAIDKTQIPTLALIARIDTAHMVMLSECGIVPCGLAVQVLRAIGTLQGEDFLPLLGRPAPRGVYLEYEKEIVTRAGPDAADVHVARSRNDLNATIFALRLREELAHFARGLHRLRSSLLDSARRHADVVMPMFSHHRPGLTSTWAHYVVGVERSLARVSDDVMRVFTLLERCPMAAGAGAGTQVPIDADLTARLLGFERGPEHSLDAVASRDTGLRGLFAAGMAATTFSRVAADLLIWAGDLEAVRLPDDLVGSSSAMPQKRNPFLLEHVIGKSGLIVGDICSALAASHAAAFANSVAVGTESTVPLFRGLATARDSAILLALVFDGAVPDKRRFGDICRRGAVGATALALRLRQSRNLPFRSAHHAVGEALRVTDGDCPVVEAAGKLGIADFPADDALELAAELTFGAGPATTDTTRLQSLAEELKADEAALVVLETGWGRADALLRSHVSRLVELNQESLS